jgi:hypothetical protein
VKRTGAWRVVNYMEQTAKILKIKGKALQTVEDVRAALSTIIDDIKSGDATVTEAKPIQKEIKTRLKEIHAQMKSGKPEDKAALKSFFGK